MGSRISGLENLPLNIRTTSDIDTIFGLWLDDTMNVRHLSPHLGKFVFLDGRCWETEILGDDTKVELVAQPHDREQDERNGDKAPHTIYREDAHVDIKTILLYDTL